MPIRRSRKPAADDSSADAGGEQPPSEEPVGAPAVTAPAMAAPAMAGRQEGQMIVYDADEAARIEEQCARDQAELNMIKAVLGTVFSVRAPRDCVAGTSSGLKTMARGLGLGLASLVAQPYIGAKNGGVKGFAKGVGAGVATCTAATVGGAVVGSAQIVRGVVNTPGAVVHKARGQVWNSEQRRWEQDWYSLPEEAAEVLGSTSADGDADEGEPGAANASGTSAASNKRPAKNVADRTFYNVLDVSPEASDAEIRRAFYKMSLRYHPDKNPDNPEATQKFQAVSEAYRVLGDEDRRRIYDEHGQDTAIAGMPKIEPMVFFAALFGSHHFEPFVGRLRLAQEVDGDLQSLLRDVVMGNEDEPPAIDVLKVERTKDKMKVTQRRREVQCAVALAERLAPASAEAADSQAIEKWEADQTAEIAKLAQVPSGIEMLYLIGWVYTNRARQFFAGGVLQRVMAKVEGKMHLAQSKAKLAGNLGRTCYRVNGVVKKTERSKKKRLEEEAKSTKSRTDNTDDKPDSTKTTETKPQEGAAKEAASGAAEGSSSHTIPTPAPVPPVDGHAEAEESASKADPPATRCESRTREAEEGADDDAADADEDAGELCPGSLVMIRGLQKSPELNDEVGMVVGYDASTDRYLVQILPDGGLKSFRLENMVVLQAAGETANAGNSSSSSAPPPGANGSGAGTSEGGEGQWAPGGEDAEMNDAFKDCMPLFHDALWSATSLDVEFTLSRVIQKVLRDMSASKTVRRKRAEALLKLGILAQEPMKQQRQRVKEASNVAIQAASSEDASSSPRASGGRTSSSSVSSKRSILARFKPLVPWRGSSSSKAGKSTQKAKDLEAKRKRMEGALAMMAVGASTEDVDEMVAARAAMEAEMGEDSPFL